MIKCKYFVYLLKSQISNDIYIGYTKNLKNRLRKHNGEICGGAKRTRKNRPWIIILYITGFEYEKTALQYEFMCHKKLKNTKNLEKVFNIMKSLLRQEKICNNAPLNSELRLIIFFSSLKYHEIWKWKSIKNKKY